VTTAMWTKWSNTVFMRSACETSVKTGMLAVSYAKSAHVHRVSERADYWYEINNGCNYAYPALHDIGYNLYELDPAPDGSSDFSVVYNISNLNISISYETDFGTSCIGPLNWAANIFRIVTIG